jgi:hypothetical protein
MIGCASGATNILELKDSLSRLSRLFVASATARQNHLLCALLRKSRRDSAARRLKRRHALRFLLDPVFFSLHLPNDNFGLRERH